MDLTDYFEMAKGFLLEPTKSFKNEGKTNFKKAFVYVLVIGIVNAVLSALFVGILSFNSLVFAGTAVMIYIGIIIGLLIGGLILHVFAYIFGARQGVEQTMKAVFYASTPAMLLGWIPFIGGIFSIWQLVLEVLGLKALQNMTTGRAALAVLTPIIIIAVVVAIGFMMLFMTLGPMGMMPTDFMQGFNMMEGFPSPGS